MALIKRRRPGSGEEVASQPVTPESNGNGHLTAPLDTIQPAVVSVEPVHGRLGNLLVERQLISYSQLADALIHQSGSGERLGELLVKAGAARRTRPDRGPGRALGPRGRRPPHRAPRTGRRFSTLPEALARELLAVPLARIDGVVAVAVADPTIPGLEERLVEAAGGPVVLTLAPPADIHHAINAAYSALAGVDKYVQAFQASESNTFGAPRRRLRATPRRTPHRSFRSST